MITVRTAAELRAALGQAREQRMLVGLVPTMGALHAGHLALIERAREQCDLVVVSLFVNPAQFDDPSDLERYPRRERDDAALAASAGADVLFAPVVGEVYPRGFATSVEVGGVSEPLEGRARGAEHFRGVATVVAKLLCMAMPDVAYFGEKDAQQLAVIRRLVQDLSLPVRIEALQTVRDADGVALSSRNALLSPAERAQARALPAALARAQELALQGERSAAVLLDAARAAMRALDVTPEYLELVDPATFQPLQTLAGEALLVVAARIGAVRLIDNAALRAVPAPEAGRVAQPREAAACSA